MKKIIEVQVCDWRANGGRCDSSDDVLTIQLVLKQRTGHADLCAQHREAVFAWSRPDASEKPEPQPKPKPKPFSRTTNLTRNGSPSDMRTREERDAVKARNAPMRQWLRANGFQVGDKGKIAQEYVELYEHRTQFDEVPAENARKMLNPEQQEVSA